MSKLNREQTITYGKKYNQHPWLKGNTEPIPIEKAEESSFMILMEEILRYVESVVLR